MALSTIEEPGVGSTAARSYPSPPPSASSSPSSAAAAPPRAGGVTLSDVCDPLFLLYCRLNRAARLNTTTLSPHVVRAQVERCFRDMEDRAVSAGLRDQYERVRVPLKCFIDMMIVHGEFDWGSQWDFVSKSECAGPGQLPFEELRRTMEDPSPEAAERLAVYHAMLSLGFQGVYFERPDELRPIYDEVAQRVQMTVNVPDELKLCPQEYHRIVRVAPQKPVVKFALTAMSVGVAVLVVFSLVANVVAYQYYTHGIRRDLDAFQVMPSQSPSSSSATSTPASPDPAAAEPSAVARRGE